MKLSQPHFPKGFVALKKYPGYFWNEVDCKLYSMKVTGVLKPLKKLVFTRIAERSINKKGSRTQLNVGDVYYRVCKSGKRFNIIVNDIEKYLDRSHTIPVQGILL